MTQQQIMHIGIDDTDSTKGGCTTYLASLLISELEKFKVKFIDYPGLIRLNPNVPWKTRGNGALSLRFKYNSEFEDEIKKAALDLLEGKADFTNKGTDPGIVFFNGSVMPSELKDFSIKAQTKIVKVSEALALIKKYNIEALGYNTCRGLIGAVAAVGQTLTEDYTYELIAYRTHENIGTKRRVDKESIIEMDRKTAPLTFNNFDEQKSRVIITPRGPDPILFGVRGESAEIVKQAYGMVKSLEPVERWVIFRSNQGTDMHLTRVDALSQLEPYRSIIAKGVVCEKPRIVPVRHVIFTIKDKSGIVDCAAYEPTGDLRKIALQLDIGDEVEVYGAVRKTRSKPLTINLEKIDVIKLATQVLLENPVCPNCGKHLKSMGKNQGFRCEKCGVRFKEALKTAVQVNRELKTSLYVTSACSQRHLTKPLRRYGQEKHNLPVDSLIDGWHSVFV